MNRAERRRLAKKQKGIPTGGLGRDPAQLFQNAFSHHQQGRLADAENGYRQVLGIAPNHPETLLNLGIVCEQLGHFDDAAENFQKVVDLNPNHPEARYNLGNALVAVGKAEEAIACYERALSLKPDYMEAHFNLANVHMNLGRFDEAATGFRTTIRLAPTLADGYFNLGFVLSETGQLEGARDAFRKVIDLQPESPEAHRQLASITKHRELDDDIRAMEALYRKSDLQDFGRENLAFGLAKAYEDIGEFPKSFEYLAEGNRLKRACFSYSTDEQKVYFSRIREIFTASLFNKFKNVGDRDASPIFIVGMPRSGTTLVEQILASHPDVFGAGELTVLSQTLRAAVGTVAQGGYADAIHNADDSRFAEIGQTYLNSLRSHSQDARFITDKMPQNFLHIGLIKLALPNAKVIHCKRTPEDNCLSIFKTYFPGAVHEYSCELTELGQYYRLYEDLMAHWHSILPGFLYDIKYEDLIDDQEGQSRALIAQCGLEWDDACLDFHKTERAITTASLAQVRRPIYRSSVELWKRYEKQLAPLVEALHSRSGP